MICDPFEDFSTMKHVIKNDKTSKPPKVCALASNKNTYKHPTIIRDTMFTAVATHTIWVEHEVPVVPLISYLLSRCLRVNNGIFVNQ